MKNPRQYAAMRAGAILSRLLIVLVLALSSLPHGTMDKSAGKAGPAAQSQLDQTQGILNADRNLLRVHLPEDDTPDPGMLVAHSPAQIVPLAFQRPAAQRNTWLLATLRILPPVRGPPVV